MINQLNEECKSGKSYLPEPCFLLWLVGCLRRQPLPRIDLRWVQVGGMEAPPPRRCVQFYEHVVARMARTAVALPVQPGPDKTCADEAFPSARPPIRRISETGRG